MILRRYSFPAMLAAATLAVCNSVGQAGQSSQIKADRWLVVASTRDVDAAIGIAGHYTSYPVQVAEAPNGWHAVVLGPLAARTVAEAIRRYQVSDVPTDAFLTRGGPSLKTVWKRDAEVERPLSPYTARKPFRSNLNGLSVKVAMARPAKGETAGPTTASAVFNGEELFSFSVGAPDDLAVGAEAAIVRLDPESEFPQIVFTRTTAGAHCCTRTWIATKPKDQKNWILLEMSEQDAEGFALFDLDRDGSFEFAQYDNNFLYMFDSYAKSYSPIVYQRLQGEKLIDVSADSVASHAVRQDLAYLEFAAKLDPTNWKSNGFLAGWVASKIRLGEGEEAWLTMLENFDRSTDFAQKECATGVEIEICPAGMVKEIPFPQALARLLEVSGYGPLPEAAQKVAN